MAAFLLALSFLSMQLRAAFAEDAFAVTAPKAGDTISVGKSTTSDVEVPISWTVPDAIAERPVLISLVQGNNLSSLSRVEQINSSAPNSGSYTWRGDVFNSALVYNYGYGAPSGCNYSIELKVWTDVVYSGYFTMINAQDGGLSSDAVCPEAGANIGPTNQTFASSTESGEASSTEASSGSPSSSSDERQGSSSSDGNDRGGGGGGGGISTTTLAVAVAVPIVVLLIVFGLILWLGIRRGWFVKKDARGGATYNASPEQGNIVVHSNEPKRFGDSNEPSVSELHPHGRPYQLEGSGLHELQGGEGGQQQYFVRN